MNYKKNKHYLETHQKIIHELFNQIEKNQMITITSICKSLKMNRSTFYEHFENIEELFEQSQDQVYSTFLKKYPKAIMNADYDFYLEFLKNVKKNQNFYKVFYHINNNVFPIKRGYTTLKKELHSSLKEKQEYDENAIRYRIIAYEAAFSHIIKEWVERGCVEKEEEIAKILNDCCHF